VNVIFILIAVSLLVAIGFLISFIWSIRSGRFDDEVNITESEENTKSQAPKTKQIPNSKHQKPNKLKNPNT